MFEEFTFNENLEEAIVLVRAGNLTKYQAIEKIKQAIRSEIEACMPKKLPDVEDPFMQDHHDIYNNALDEYRSALLRRFGGK